jgi:hypothetical protein
VVPDLTIDVDGVQVRKGSRSAMNDCVYLNSPDNAKPFAYDSKSEEKLPMTPSARTRLMSAIAAGGLALSLFGILSGGDMTHNPPHNPSANSSSIL